MNQWYVLIGGVQTGPITPEDLRERIQSGAVTARDLVWTDRMPEWAPAGTIPELFPHGAPVEGYLRPHRAASVLALGILGIVPCFICGIIAWVMGKNDLKEMDAGTMDPSGRDMTKAGKICGMVGTLIACTYIALYALMFVILIIVGATTTYR